MQGQKNAIPWRADFQGRGRVIREVVQASDQLSLLEVLAGIKQGFPNSVLRTGDVAIELEGFYETSR